MPVKALVSTRRRPLAQVLVAITCVLTIVLVDAAPAVGDVSFINERRSASGLAPVSPSAALASVARAHSRYMADRNSLAHSPNLPRAVSEVLPEWIAVGENVGVGESLGDVNATFMTSATHRAVILGNYNLAGVGAVTGSDGRLWVTQVFARVATAAPAPPAAPQTQAAAPRVGVSAPRVVTRRTSRSRAAGDARALPTPQPPAPPRQPLTVGGMAASRGGYQLIGADGGVFSFDNAPFMGSGSELGISERIVAGANTRAGDGYVLFGREGGVFSFGAAPFHGSGSQLALGGKVVGGAMSSTDLGYTLFAEDGGVLAFGDAVFHGSAVDQPGRAAIVGGAVTPAGNGYWLAGADGSIYPFGRAPMLGSPADLGPLRAPIVGMATTPTGDGYWVVAADGGVFAFGDAPYAGSAADQDLAGAVTAVAASPSGKGYWLVLDSQEVLAYGDLSVPDRRRRGDGPASRLI